MKKVGIMQPYLFPHLAYFQLMNAVDEYVIYDDVQYIKGGWINRNNILVGGSKVLFTITLKEASPNKNINQIDISDNFEKFLKTITMAYAKAPYYEQVFNLLKKICEFDDRNTARFIGNSFMEIASYLDIKTKFIYSSDLTKDNALRGQDKVLAICHELEADQYVNAIGGQALYDRETFSENNIRLMFLKTNEIEYRQLKSDFIPGLSIIDVMMFNSKEDAKRLLNEYELI